MQRHKQFDIMLFLGIIMVVMGHNYTPQYVPFYPPYSFHVPLFFFISGYFFKPLLNFKEKQDWIIYKIKDQLLLYFAFNLLFFIIDSVQYFYLYNTVKSDLLYNFFITPFIDGHQYSYYIPAWFLVQLFIANVVLQLVAWNNSKKYGWYMLGICFLINLFTLRLGLKGAANLELVAIRTSMALFFMLIGYMFNKYENVLKPILIKLPVFICLFIIVNLLNQNLGGIEYSMVSGNVQNEYIFVPLISSSLIILMLYTIAHYVSLGVQDNSIVITIGQNSLHIMIWHLTVITIVKLILMLLGKGFLGDVINVYKSHNVEKFWLLYQLPAILVPVWIAENLKKVSLKKLLPTRKKALANLIILIVSTALLSCTNNKINSGDELALSQNLTSSNKRFKLLLQGDGNLVVYNEKYDVVWASNSQGHPITRCILESNGNLTLCDNEGKSYWESNTNIYPNSSLILDNDGHLKILNKNVVIWDNGQRILPKLSPLEYITSNNDKYRLILQTDGNLVIYNDMQEPIWATATVGQAVSQLIFQDDGNLVLYSASGDPIWATNTANNLNTNLTLGDDGVLRIVKGTDVLWSSEGS